ncbi:zinc ribbon domain-containing protein [Gemmata sp. JC673]|uniref:Zinc ribbon domain-containing protein n=1 Tax=Gemmata algarum TaxID=2975278 RepID=A0ABU5FBJ3_9BACT|nr:hypothetical protein [Gemmata algarum]MDY3563788.1 zinc ribbon domain-containing protein [Gemmata algarum]
MALVLCTECGKNVSTLATSCPHCGCPLSFADNTSPPPTAPQRPAAQPAEDKGARLREELARFKRRFAAATVDLDGPASDSEVWRELLDKEEELLTAVCGWERYRSLIDSANNLRKLHTLVENTLPNTERRAARRRERGRAPRPGHVLHDDQYESELASLKRRVEGIEYRA